MQINIHVHQHLNNEHKILKKLNQIIMEQSVFAEQLIALKDQLAKAKTEILAKLTALGDALEAADDVAPEVLAAFDELKAAVQAQDDIVPDAPTEPTE